nr:SdpI family protein [Halobacterium sp. TGN-42-S1]
MLVAVAVLASALAAPELPARMATHWNAAGDVDGTMPTWLGLSLTPAVAALTVGFFHVLPRLDPRNDYDDFRDAYDALALATVGFVVYAHGFVLVVNLGVDVAPMQALAPALGGVYVVAGVVTARTDQNWFVGARTPWTLEDEGVWADTNRLVGRVLVAGGPVAAAGVLVPSYALALAVAPAVLAAAATVGYSYWRYRHA